MNCEEISRYYKEVGESLIERTGPRGTRDSGLRSMGDTTSRITERIHKILLRVGFEFLVKAIYLKEERNIYELKHDITEVNKFDTIENIGESNLNLNYTIGFYNLIDHLGDLSCMTDNASLSELKENLKAIVRIGNPAVHRERLSEEETTKINRTKGTLLSLLQ